MQSGEAGGESAVARLVRVRDGMVRAVGPAEGAVGLLSPAAQRWNDYLLDGYEPPPGKPILALWQCSVRRPFSNSPSHASLRLAVRLATGFDPVSDFAACPVHPVVLASTLGPAPYELERVWPACIRAHGVNQMDDAQFAEDGAVLADRLAEYLAAHARCHEHVVTFTTGRYGLVAARAAAAAGVRAILLPQRHGAELVRRGTSRPRKYWERWWIQLAEAIIDCLPPAEQARAAERLASADLVIDRGAGSLEDLFGSA